MNRGHRFRSKPLPVRLSGRAARQANREHRTLARFAGHGHISAHHACELARQRKAEAGSTVTPREVGFRNRPWPVVDAAASFRPSALSRSTFWSLSGWLGARRQKRSVVTVTLTLLSKMEAMRPVVLSFPPKLHVLHPSTNMVHQTRDQFSSPNAFALDTA